MGFFNLIFYMDKGIYADGKSGQRDRAGTNQVFNKHLLQGRMKITAAHESVLFNGLWPDPELNTVWRLASVTLLWVPTWTTVIPLQTKKPKHKRTAKAEGALNRVRHCFQQSSTRLIPKVPYSVTRTRSPMSAISWYSCPLQHWTGLTWILNRMWYKWWCVISTIWL